MPNQSVKSVTPSVFMWLHHQLMQKKLKPSIYSRFLFSLNTVKRGEKKGWRVCCESVLENYPLGFKRQITLAVKSAVCAYPADGYWFRIQSQPEEVEVHRSMRRTDSHTTHFHTVKEDRSVKRARNTFTAFRHVGMSAEAQRADWVSLLYSESFYCFRFESVFAQPPTDNRKIRNCLFGFQHTYCFKLRKVLWGRVSKLVEISLKRKTMVTANWVVHKSACRARSKHGRSFGAGNKLILQLPTLFSRRQRKVLICCILEH